MGINAMAGTLLKRFTGCLTEERSLTTLLVLLIINLLIIIPATYVHHWIVVINRLVLTLVLLSGLLYVLQYRVLSFMSLVFVFFAIGVQWFTLAVDHPWLSYVKATLSALSLVSIMIVVSVQVNREGPVTAHRVRGAIALYLLIGTLFAYAYTVIEALHPGSFQFPEWLSKQAPDWNESLLYFSIVTLTTLGYGDVTAVHPVARSLVMVEALIGQLYPAILIARLVTLELETRRSVTGKGPNH